ncbi:uncharacterized protein LOC125528730 isoform X2 [Triticum urartu]|uniref:uncharacterized protein LOC125528730 isoform X2 n=1 Tax=Triticum urartu TaxID=4572 RepID=UPI00204371DD|nr:uncharacterized protein LOC125528730 isoform X2 [Triticum urartu]XP_048549126.1 uncharacterized protein LOC125528730 isoform X2 [Triticum urartu]
MQGDDATGDLQEVVARLAAPAPQCEMKFAALGNSIFIATSPRCGQTPTLVYDTDTALLAIGPRLPAPLLPRLDIAVAAGDTLYALSSVHSTASQQHPFEALTRQDEALEPELSDGELSLTLKLPSSMTTSPPRPSMEGWSWKTVRAPPPFAAGYRIVAYAHHLRVRARRGR